MPTGRKSRASKPTKRSRSSRKPSKKPLRPAQRDAKPTKRKSRSSMKSSPVNRKTKSAVPRNEPTRLGKSLGVGYSQPQRQAFSRANSQMNLDDLQFMAKSRGIPFGGLSRTKLIKKINNYS